MDEMDARRTLQGLLEDAGWEGSNSEKIAARIDSSEGSAWIDGDGYRVIVEVHD